MIDARTAENSLLTKIRRKTFEFHHPKQTAPITIRAWSEAGAWKKVRSFVMSNMFGGFAITYNSAALDKVMREIACREVKS